jgi:hypothetical protein
MQNASLVTPDIFGQNIMDTHGVNPQEPAMQNASVDPPQTHPITATTEEDRESRKEEETTSQPTHE